MLFVIIVGTFSLSILTAFFHLRLKKGFHGGTRQKNQQFAPSEEPPGSVEYQAYQE